MLAPLVRRLGCRLAVALLLVPALATFPAAARAAATPHPAAAASAPLTPAEAQSLLAVLNDPGKRAAFSRTLSELMAASREVAARTAPSPAGLAPHSVGAELLTGVGTFGTSLAAEAHEGTRALRTFRQIGPWFHGIVADPVQRNAVIAGVWRLAVVLGVALAAVLGVERLIRRPIATLARIAGGAPAPAVPPESLDAPEPDIALADEASVAVEPVPPLDALVAAETAEETEIVRHRHGARLLRLLHALRRVPLAAAHFVLELLPVLAFVVVTAAFGVTGFVSRSASLLVVSAATRGFVIGGVLIGLVNTLFAPDTPSLRLLLVHDGPARRVAFWCRLGISIGAFSFAAIVVAEMFGLPFFAVTSLTKVVVLAEHVVLALLIIASRADVAHKLQPPRRLRGPTRRILGGLARRWWLYALFFDFAFWVIWAAEVRHGYARLWTFTIETMAVVVAARVVGIALLGGLERSLRLAPDTASRHPWLQTRADRYYPVLRRLVTFLVIAASSVTVLEVWGLHAYGWFARDALGGRVVGAALSVLASIAVGAVIWEAVNTALDRHLDRLRLDPVGGAARIARLNTLLPMLRILLFIFVATVVVLTILSEIGVDIAPLLGGAGIVGVAIGFGSQKLVQDFITGIFLLLENTMQVGDTITAGGLSGSVEHLSIRTMRLRAGDGSIHVIPFSSVSTVTNTNRGLGNAAVSVDIAPEEDPDRAADILKAIALDMRDDEAFRDAMLSDLQYWGVNAVTSQAVTLAGQIVCTDKGRWGVQREFNRRMRQRLFAEGIRLATPVQHVTFERERRPVAEPEEEERSEPMIASPAPNALGHDS